MKLSSRKQLLSEAEQELKGIRHSINEEAVPQREVEKVTQWLTIANKVVHETGSKQYEKMENFIEDFFRYLEIAQGAKPRDAKQFKKNAEFSVDILQVLIGKVKENLSTLKKLEAKLPEIQKIIKAVESDMKKMK